MIENKVTGKNVFTTNLRIFKSLLTSIKFFPQNSEMCEPILIDVLKLQLRVVNGK